jgi:hypothetical protein
MTAAGRPGPREIPGRWPHRRADSGEHRQKDSEVQVVTLSGGPVFLSWYAGTMAAPFPTSQDI